MAGEVLSGIGGNLTLTGEYSTLTVEIFEWNLTVEPEQIERTTFATSGIYRKWYQGTPTVTASFTGHWPSGVTFPTADVVEGAGNSTLALRTQDATTDFVITLTGMVQRLRQTVNRRSGLNGCEGEFIGRISASAGVL